MRKSVPTQQAASERLRVAEPQREFTPHVVSPLTSACPGRIIVTLMNALDKYDLKRGVAALCIGGGEATAIAIERVQ